MITNLAIFVIAAFFEIAGCFAFWMWLRRGVTPFVALLGIASLIGFAVALTRIDSAFAGRAYAAYGGIYITASLVWLWAAEGQRPHRRRPCRGDSCGDRSPRHHRVCVKYPLTELRSKPARPAQNGRNSDETFEITPLLESTSLRKSSSAASHTCNVNKTNKLRVPIDGDRLSP